MKTMIKNKRNEAGVVSIMVTMVMMIVISLIVLGFAEISRNEQRNTLDSQLNVQAYYAAESGVNDAREAINAQLNAGQIVQNKTTCRNSVSYNFTGTVDASHNVSYTCVLIDAAPATLVFNVGYTSTVVPVISTGSPFNNVTLSWDLPTGAVNGSAAGCYANLSSLGRFPGTSGNGSWSCDYPVVRVDMLDANGVLARSNWSTNTATMFFVPFNSNGVANTITLAARGAVVPARCNATSCKANIAGLNGTKYYMRITTLYRTDSRLTLTSSGSGFSGAQATIDSTGRAQDILRRILVAVDLTGANRISIPNSALNSEDSVCKRFGVTNKSFTVYSDIDMRAGANNDPLCMPQSSGTPAP